MNGDIGCFPRIALSLHAGYVLRLMRPMCGVLDQRRLSKCHSGPE
jgi:hypothetical protein